MIVKNKEAGYWKTKVSHRYPNPFLVKLCKTLWKRHGNFLIVSEGFHTDDEDEKLVNVIQSGPIPRIFKMVKALAQIMGLGLHENGNISTIKPKNVSALKRWYE